MEELLRRAEQGGSYHKKTSRVYNTAARIGETRSNERDEHLGRETISLERELEGQSVSIVKHRSLLTGEENTLQDLHNVPSDHVHEFDRRWEAASRSAMPSYHAAIAEHSHPQLQ
eukprot:TRINITY_DN33895_c0_g1_i1.p1 TRINITY_DN33895_c0_g1~~TRINITY_DN33895_c0_g1_i1.p1  ORF type:complete len:115 (+),score=27.17 TRINITY_DN33895_c0_g1_i1:51-395(+)